MFSEAGACACQRPGEIQAVAVRSGLWPGACSAPRGGKHPEQRPSLTLLSRGLAADTSLPTWVDLVGTRGGGPAAMVFPGGLGAFSPTVAAPQPSPVTLQRPQAGCRAPTSGRGQSCPHGPLMPAPADSDDWLPLDSCFSLSEWSSGGGGYYKVQFLLCLN